MHDARSARPHARGSARFCKIFFIPPGALSGQPYIKREKEKEKCVQAARPVRTGRSTLRAALLKSLKGKSCRRRRRITLAQRGPSMRSHSIFTRYGTSYRSALFSLVIGFVFACLSNKPEKQPEPVFIKERVQDQAAELDEMAEQLRITGGAISDPFVRDYSVSICGLSWEEDRRQYLEANPIDTKKLVHLRSTTYLLS